jgi:hypothetical protein
MPAERIKRGDAISKKRFHALLQRWIETTDEEVVGPEDIDERTSWVHVREGGVVFGLHADTSRKAVRSYLQLVRFQDDDLAWEIVASQKGKMTALVYGPDRVRIKPFYLYVLSK